MEVNRRWNRKSLLYTLIRDRNGREKSWFLQGNACQGNSSKLQSLIAGVCRTFTGMQSWYSDKLSAQNMTKSPCGVIIFQGLDGTSETLFFKSLQFFLQGRLTKILYAAIFTTLLHDFKRPPSRENSIISPSAFRGCGAIILPPTNILHKV